MSIYRNLFTAVLLALAVPAGAVFAQDSISELRAQVNAVPEDAGAWTALGDALLQAGQLEDAKSAFHEAIALDYMQGDAHFGLGLAEYRRGDFQAALFSFSEVARLYPERFDGHFNRGVTLARLRMPSEAADAFRSALDEAEPEARLEDMFNAATGLAGQLKALGDYDAAAEAYAEAIGFDPEDEEVRYLHAEALHLAGRGLEALPLLTELDQYTRDYRVSSLIADIYLDQGQTDYALRALQRAIDRAEAAGSAEVLSGAYLKLGLVQRNLGRPTEALNSFQRAASVNPASWQAHYNVGVSYLESGRLADAILPLETAAALSPASGEARLALATAYELSGRGAEAVEHGRLALELLEDEELQVQAAFVLGRAEYRTGDHAAAAARLAGVTAARPEDAQAQLWAGIATYQTGDYETAAQFYERAVQLDPANISARTNLGAAYLAAGRYQDAEFVYQDLVTVNEADAASHYNLGWALLSQNRLSQARDAFATSSALGYSAADEALTTYF